MLVLRRKCPSAELHVYTTGRVGQLVRGCPSLTKVSCSSLGYAAALKLGWESFAALVVLPGLNPDLVGAPMVLDTGWFNQKKKELHVYSDGNTMLCSCGHQSHCSLAVYRKISERRDRTNSLLFWFNYFCFAYLFRFFYWMTHYINIQYCLSSQLQIQNDGQSCRMITSRSMKVSNLLLIKFKTSY